MAEAQQQKSARVGETRIWVIDLILVAAFVAVIYRPLVFTSQTLTSAGFSDLLTLTQPSFVYTGHALARGELPLWNPNWFAGYPHLAMPSASVFYPTTILFGLLSFPVAIKIVVLLHCFLAGAFSYALGRQVFEARMPSLYFAFVTVAGDLVLPALPVAHLWTLQTLTWFPLTVLFVHRLFANGRWGSVVGLAATIALMIFGGDPQVLAFAILLLTVYTAVLGVSRIVSAPAEARRTIVSGACCALGIVFGVGLAGIQLLPSQELYAQSVRAGGVAFEYINLGAEPRLMQVIFGLRDQENWNVLAASRVVLALAAIGLVFWRQSMVWAMFAAAAACVLYGNMPRWFYDAVIQHVPIYNGMRGAFRITCVVGWAITYLSAFGIAFLLRRVRESRSLRSGPAPAFIVVLTVLAVLPLWIGEGLSAGQWTACAIAAVGAGLAFLPDRFRIAPRAAVAFVLAAATIELGWHAQRIDFSGDTEGYRVRDDFAEFSASRTDLDRIGLAHRHAAFPQGPAVGLLTDDRLLQGFHALLLTRYARLLDEVGGLALAPHDDRGRLLDTRNFPVDWISSSMVPLLDLFNVRYVVSVEQRPGFSALGDEVRRFKPITGGKFSVYENTGVLPPVYPIHEMIAADDDEAIVLLKDGRIDYRKQTIVPKDFAAPALRAATAPEPVTIREYLPERIVVDAELSAPAIVVFSEMYYPGWRAYVDGVQYDVMCVNTAFRGVYVEPGKRTIELRYVPASLRAGVIMSAVSLLTIVAGIGMWLHSRRRARKTDQITPA